MKIFLSSTFLDLMDEREAVLKALHRRRMSTLAMEDFLARIAGDLKQGGGAGVEQQVIHHALVLQCKRSEFARQGEDDMHVAGGEQLAVAGFEPAHPGVAPASWAMLVTARVEGDGGMSAVGALIAMSSQRSGAAAGD